MSHSSFDTFGFKSSILSAIARAGFTTPTPIQQMVIPVILSGVDVVAQAQTGTGKTAAFGLPALQVIENENGVELLVITPTRELAQQVCDELGRLGKDSGIRAFPVYGGVSMSKQMEAIHRGVNVVVATPGRLLDLLRSSSLPFNPRMVVLDEADEMLDMGFLEDIQQIFTYLPDQRQTLLFSATMPGPIQNLAKKILKSPVFVKTTKQEIANNSIKQFCFLIKEFERDDALVRLMDAYHPQKAIVFCRTKLEVDRLTGVLIANGYSAKPLHGDMEQNQRQHVTQLFRNGMIDVLVATDVAARGLDITDVTHVFNFHIPFDAENYVHRIGRTGRAGKDGVAITLVTPKEYQNLQRIIRSQGGNIELLSIPTRADVRKLQSKILTDEIRRAPVSEEAQLILDSLKDEMDPTQQARLAISLLLKQYQVSGPDKIGMMPGEFQAPFKDKQGGRDRPYRAPRNGRFARNRINQKKTGPY